MANTDERRTGPTEVEQGKNANEIIDASDDIPEKRVTTTKEKTQDDLDRGEELYQSFGFGNLSDTSKFNNKDGYKHLSDDRSPKKTEQLEVPSTIEATPLVTDDEMRNPSIDHYKDIDHAHDHSHGESTVNQENPTKTYDPADERKVVWDKPTPTHTVPTTITSTDATDKQPASKEKVVDNMQLEKYTRLIIEPKAGDVAYHEQDINRLDRVGRLTPDEQRYITDLGQRETVGHHTDIHHIATYDKKQTPDYELAEVYYTRTNAGVSFYNPSLYEVRKPNINVLPIKNHYKSQIKEKKKNQFPWGKVAIGVAATLGAIGLVSKLTEDDDDYFWS